MYRQPQVQARKQVDVVESLAEVPASSAIITWSASNSLSDLICIGLQLTKNSLCDVVELSVCWFPVSSFLSNSYFLIANLFLSVFAIQTETWMESPSLSG